MEDRRKLLYLPKITTSEQRIKEPQERKGVYPCPCCGYKTFPVSKEDAVAFICPVCFWENDAFDPAEDVPSDENRGMTLCQGRENYRRFGAVRPDLVQYARQPKAEELPET